MNKQKKTLISFRNYLSTLKKTLNYIDMHTLLSISNFLKERMKYKNNIFVAGNGGSAAVANHLLCEIGRAHV